MMKVLFITLLDFSSLDEQGIYTDLLRQFVNNGHEVFVISPYEKRRKLRTRLIVKDSYKILKLRVGNVQKTNLVEKTISILMFESHIINAIKTYFTDVQFDLVIYSTPPITILKAIEFVKRRDKSKTYLLLKDIFPQNALDLGMMFDRGLKSLFYRYFKTKEKKLYLLSDFIGCMSEGNVDYLSKHYSYLNPKTIEVCPNSIEPIDSSASNEQICKTREKYGVPDDSLICLYGGNLGRPQSVEFIIKCLESNKENNEFYFLIAGSGTESKKLEYYLANSNSKNAILIGQLEKAEYDQLVFTSDIGLVFLDHRFTIPNIPSRILSYMQASKPILAATDKSTDLRQIIEVGKFGFWCESTDVTEFNHGLSLLKDQNIRLRMGQNGRQYLEKNYNVKDAYEKIIHHFI